MNFPPFFVIDRVCRDCNIHDRMSFASFFGAALIVIAIVLLAGAALTSLHPPRYRYAGVCVTKPSLLESRDDIW
jgi:hypothetical protein